MCAQALQSACLHGTLQIESVGWRWEAWLLARFAARIESA